MATNINFIDPPKKSLEELLTIYNPQIFLVMDDVLESVRTYRIVFQDLLDILKHGYEYKEIRSRSMRFKFHKKDTKIRTLELRHLLSNLILWKAFIDIDKIDLLDSSYIYDFTKFNIDSINHYINTKILPIHDGDFASKNEAVDEISYAIRAIANAFSILFGISISIYNLVEFEKRIPEASRLIRDPLPDNLQPNELEALMKERTSKLIQLIVTDPGDNDLKPLFVAGRNMSEAQFREWMMSIGLKSDINGHTVPVLINDNFLMTGLTRASSIYLVAGGGRKSMLLSKLSMGVPGAFSKKLNQNTTASGILRKDHDCCDSIATVDYTINDATFLKLLNGRYYYDQYGVMHQLDGYNDTHLIGKIVRFKSPATCASDDGHTVCKYCYGHLYDINYDLISAGCFASTKITEPAGQSILSAKHQQDSDSSEISLSPQSEQLFDIVSNEVCIREESELDGAYSMILCDVQIEESDDTEFYYTTKVDIIDETNKFVFHMDEEHGARMYLNDELLTAWKKLKDKNAPIYLDDLDDETPLFTVEIKNQELTNLIEVLQKTLNTNDHLGASNVSEFCQIFAENLIKFGIKYDLVHAEMVIRSLLRKRSDIYEFPNWTASGNPEDYQMLSLNSALYNNPSALVSMSYGHLRRQLISAELYLKSAPSHLDPLFARRLSDVIVQD